MLRQKAGSMLTLFSLACLLGLGLAILGLSNSRILRQSARFYVEIIRGIPMLVLLFYIAFVGAPAFVAFWNFITAPLQSIGLFGTMGIRDFSLLWRAIIALMIAASQTSNFPLRRFAM